jgi:hypothetical protein
MKPAAKAAGFACIEVAAHFFNSDIVLDLCLRSAGGVLPVAMSYSRENCSNSESDSNLRSGARSSTNLIVKSADGGGKMLARAAASRSRAPTSIISPRRTASRVLSIAMSINATVSALPIGGSVGQLCGFQ